MFNPTPFLIIFCTLLLTSTFAQDLEQALVIDHTFEDELIIAENSFGNAIGFETWGDTADNVTLERTTVSSDSNLARENQSELTTVLQINREIASWGGFTHIFSDGEKNTPLNLKAYSGISFWFYGTAEGDRIFFELF